MITPEKAQFWMWFNVVFFALNGWMYTCKWNKTKTFSFIAAVLSLACAIFWLAILRNT